VAASRKIPETLRVAARERAKDRCEYCGLPSAFGNPRHQVDHVIPVQHGGLTEFENLAYACAHCNRYKGPNLSGRDPETRKIVTLFNPRTDRWASHFTLDGALFRGRTPCGRATVATFQINHPLRVTLREHLIEAGFFIIV